MELLRAARRWFTIAFCAYLAASCAPRTAGSLDEAQRLAAARRGDDAARVLATVRPATKEAWLEAAGLWSRLAGYEHEAAAALAPAADSGDPDLVLVATRAAIAADRLPEARAWLERELAARPGDVEAAVELAKLLGRIGKTDASVALLAARAGDDPRLLNLLGYSELLDGRLEDGRAHLERSVTEAQRRGKDYAPPHYHLGLYHLAKHEPEAALTEFRRAAEVNPQHLEAHYQALATAEALGRAAEAAPSREAFDRLYRAKLGPSGALDDNPVPNPFPVDRGENVEARVAVAGAEFERPLPAGSTVEFGCLAPAAGAARFTVTISDGPGQGTALVDVVHEGEPRRGVWVPHRVELPAGAAGARTTLAFRIRPASRWSAWFGGKPPAGAAFSEPGTLASATARSADARPNIVLISLDTLRADHVGAWGNARAPLPSIDALAATGVRFARAEAASSWTLPSHYSLLSGLTPAAHGVLPDLEIVRGYVFPDRKLAIKGSGREVMLAEALSEKGYRTAAVTEDGWVAPKFGFDQGFRVFRAALEGSLPGTVAGTLAELETAGTRGPWFLFVHTYATHQPYHAPKALRTKWADAAHVGFALPAGRVPIDDYYRFRSPLFPPAPSDVRAFRDLYDGQAAWADELVASVLDWLKAKGLLEQTVIVVTSDHGEEIFERGQFDHGDTLFEEVTHVPLVIAAPGRVPAGRVVDGTVSLVDLPATLLDLAGAGETLGEGRTLRPLWSGAEAPGTRAAFAQVVGHGAEPVSAAWSGSLKLIRRETKAGLREQLFDLARDPGETRDLSGSRAADVATLRAVLLAHERKAHEIRGALGTREEHLDQETIDKLKSLGYVK